MEGLDIIGSQLLHIDVVDSTNTYLVQQSQRRTLPEGTVVVAEHQRAGRGQQGNRWESTRGDSLTCSVLLHPHKLPARQAFQLNKLAALALRDALIACGVTAPIALKWPNDVWVADQKVAGILIENSVQGTHLQQSVLGFGVNVKSHPVGQRATHVDLHTPQEASVGNVLQALIDALNYQYRILQMQQFAKQDDAYLRHLYLLNKPHTYWVQGLPVQGTIRGVTPEGLLQLETQGGILHFATQEIAFYPPHSVQ